LEILNQNDELESLTFFDDYNINLPQSLAHKFPILRNETQVAENFKKFGITFTLGIDTQNKKNAVR